MKAFDSTPGATCYTLGCLDPTFLSTRHKRYGMVETCRSHDPARHAYGAPFFLPGFLGSSPQAPPRGPSGGSRVPLVPRAPVFPPAPAMAVPGRLQDLF